MPVLPIITGVAGAVGAVSKLAGGGSSSSGGQQAVGSSPTQDLAAITKLNQGKNNPVDTSKGIKAAKQANVGSKTGVLDDPWQPTKDWYKDLGGTGDLNTDNLLL